MSSEEDIKVDFVIPWVDGSDPAWQKDFNQYTPSNKNLNNKSRFTDWDNLKYIFRAFEEFTPWVNKVFFITWGHLPEWINRNHPKLTIVRHEDYLKKDYLPVFNSHPIEINIHRINNLSENFVYFNDDFFILNNLDKEEFFFSGKPVDFCISDATHDGLLAHIILNDIDIINKNFNRHIAPHLEKNKIIRMNLQKWFTPKYGLEAFRNLFFMQWKGHTGFKINHHPQPYLKSTFKDVWNKEQEVLERTSSSRFRSNEDINQYLFRYWQLVKGDFYPACYRKWKKERKHVEIRTLQDAINCAEDIKSRSFKHYCINDAIFKGRYTKVDMPVQDFILAKKTINNALNEILPKKSGFEL